jgi:hypothetical protein
LFVLALDDQLHGLLDHLLGDLVQAAAEQMLLLGALHRIFAAGRGFTSTPIEKKFGRRDFRGLVVLVETSVRTGMADRAGRVIALTSNVSPSQSRGSREPEDSCRKSLLSSISVVWIVTKT